MAGEKTQDSKPDTISIEERNSEQVINIALNTIDREKQALVFINTRRGAESQAEKISGKLDKNLEGIKLADKALKALSSPTKQCRRLAKCLRKGIAFHHAGLHSKQKNLVEEGFREGEIRVICATPTLAQGLDLPAFRTVIRDLKRFSEGSWGMTDIPVLEYEQMAGRAGRPGMEDYGEAICMVKKEKEKEKVLEKYIEGEPEEIFSKLAVEPVLRTYVLSLIATGFADSRDSLQSFFRKSFYAEQYGDMEKLESIINKMVTLLEKWNFIEIAGSSGEFVSGDKFAEKKIKATPLGERVAELYLDPYTANHLATCLKRADQKKTVNDFGILQMVSSCLEMKPLLKVKKSEFEEVQNRALPFMDDLYSLEPKEFSSEYEEFMDSVKTALFLYDWVKERNQKDLMEKYGVRPGGVQAKCTTADWLLYSAGELCRIMDLKEFKAPLSKMRVRVKYGAKEELIPLLKLKRVGRVRARKLYKNGIKDVKKVKETSLGRLKTLIGEKNALHVKKQVGEEIDPEKIRVEENKRKGQKSLKDYKG